MTENRKRTLIGSLIVSVLSICGCGHPAVPEVHLEDSEAAVIEKISVMRS